MQQQLEEQATTEFLFRDSSSVSGNAFAGINCPLILLSLAVGSPHDVHWGVPEGHAQGVPRSVWQEEEAVRDWGAHLEFCWFHDQSR